MAITSRPAKRTALAATFLCLLFFGIAHILGRWSGFFSISEIGWFMGSAGLIWFVLALQFHQSDLAEQEKLDVTQAQKDDKSSTIFQRKNQDGAVLAVAQQRLITFKKWFIPLFSIVIAAYQLALGFYLFRTTLAGAEPEPQNPLLCAICMTAVAFVSFLMSRYATGMSFQQQWKPLRAGGSILLAAAVLSFALAIGLALAQFEIFVVNSILTKIIPLLLIITGLETALNIVLDIYRPRAKDKYDRSPFDSRLLGVISEPGGIFHTAAGAIDYQFGFKVSNTWFYKLLEKAIMPLIIFSAVTIYLLSCVVIVEPNEKAIIEHFGNPVTRAGDIRIIGSGLTFKWPWPIDIARRYPVEKINELTIGYVPKINPRTGQPDRSALLWGESHYEKEYTLLVASEQATEQFSDEAVPVSLVIAAVPVQYKIKNLYDFAYNHRNSEKLLEAICYRELTKFASSATIGVDSESAITRSLLGAGRSRAKEILTAAMQAAADKEKLGVEIVFVGMQGIHPPVKVAKNYQDVIASIQKKQTLMLKARAERNKILSSIAGSVKNADDLYGLASEYQKAKKLERPDKAEELAGQLDRAFSSASGDIFKALRQSQSYAFEKSTLSKATGLRFSDQLKAYRASGEIYKCYQRLTMFEEALKNIRKFVVAADKNDMQIFIIDMQEKLTPSLYDITGLEETK